MTRKFFVKTSEFQKSFSIVHAIVTLITLKNIEKAIDNVFEIFIDL